MLVYYNTNTLFLKSFSLYALPSLFTWFINQEVLIVSEHNFLILKFHCSMLVGLLEARGNVLENNRRVGFRRIWKTLFVTVAVNQVKHTLYTFLVSFMILLIWPEWMTSYFLTRCKIFLEITHQTTLREARPNTAPLFSKVGLRKFVLVSELFERNPCFIRHLTAKKPAKISDLVVPSPIYH